MSVKSTLTMPIYSEAEESFIWLSDLYMPVTVYPHFDMQGGYVLNHFISRRAWSLVTEALLWESNEESVLGDD